MKTGLFFAGILGALLFTFYTLISGYTLAKKGIEQYSCHSYAQPFDCLKK
jgi:hypothetical protein